MKSIFILIGMPGSGKSTLGRIISERLNMHFLDTDKLLEQKYGQPLNKLLNSLGETEFKKAEEDVISSICSQNCIIATGGSAVYSPKAMQHLSKIGTVIYIQITPEMLKYRIKNPATRGIVLANGETIEEIYYKRIPLYEKYAQVKILSTDEAPQKTAEKLITILKNRELI